jgi:hypothetical protein
VAGVIPPTPEGPPSRRIVRRHGANPQGNERLTAMTGAVLLVLFAAECYTLFHLFNLMTLHFFLGMLLIGPVGLKIGSTVWRFTRYYTGSAPYVRQGPPAPLPRVLGPLLILTSLAVLASGVALAIVGPGPGIWLRVHRDAFLAWVVVVVIHVIIYGPKLPRLLAGASVSRAGQVLAGRRARWLLLGGSLAAGLIVAVLGYHLADRWG